MIEQNYRINAKPQDEPFKFRPFRPITKLIGNTLRLMCYLIIVPITLGEQVALIFANLMASLIFVPFIYTLLQICNINVMFAWLFSFICLFLFIFRWIITMMFCLDDEKQKEKVLKWLQEHLV